MDLGDGEMSRICLEALDGDWVERGALGYLVGQTRPNPMRMETHQLLLNPFKSTERGKRSTSTQPRFTSTGSGRKPHLRQRVQAMLNPHPWNYIQISISDQNLLQQLRLKPSQALPALGCVCRTPG